MSTLTAAPVPRSIDDAAVRMALRSEYAYAERLRTAIFGWMAVVLLGLFAVLEGLSAAGADIAARPPREAGVIVVAVAILLAALQFAIAQRVAQSESDPARALLWYGATLIEVLLIIGAWGFASSYASVVRSAVPGLIAFASLVILSALRLDWRLTSITTVLAAAGHAYLHLRLLERMPLDAVRPRTFDSVVSLLVIGALTAFVAEQARRRTVNALRAIGQTRALEREIIDAEDAARSRIGRDLHDGLGGHLSGIALMAKGLARRAEAGASTSAASLEELAALSQAGVEEVRRLAHGLDPAPVERGLVAALQQLADRTEVAGTRCRFLTDGDATALDPTTTAQLYHIAHEATTNALRHGEPTRVDLTLTVRPGTVTLDVRDDGCGVSDAPTPGLGLRTMAARSALLNGVLRVRAVPSGGTVVTCVVPR